MAIPDFTLNKPGQLEPVEMSVMKEHPYHGYQIIKKISFLSEPAEIVYAHHGCNSPKAPGVFGRLDATDG
jgi:HD-GYP domain-containing protein (c-di-GMP phosphodiesterase class II)